MNEADLRALALAALARIEAARSGRVRTETIDRPGGRFDMVESARSSSDLIFDYDIPATSSRLEIAVGPDYQSVIETIAFPGRERFYSRVMEVGDLGLTAADYPDGELPTGLDDTARPEAELWSRVSPGQYGMNPAEFLRPVDYSWLRSIIADPDQHLRLIGTHDGRTTLDFSIRGDQFGGVDLRDTAKAQAMELGPEEAVTVRLVIADPNLERLTFALPPDADGDAMLIEAYYWRMGEPVSIVEPDSSECRPALEPVHTTIAALEPVSSRRWLMYEFDEASHIVMCPYSERESGEPYVPLAAGDHLRIWGTTRRPPAAPLGASFDLWAAATLDGRFIFDRRPNGDSSIWRRRFWAAVGDVIDREVVLARVEIELKRMRASFADPLEADVPEIYLDQTSGGDADVLALVGEPVIVRAAQYGRDTVIVRVERPDGAAIYDLVSGTGWK
jgi:hypothetical protein